MNSSSHINNRKCFEEARNILKNTKKNVSIDSNLDIPADTIVVVEAGSDLGFYGDHGVAVHGELNLREFLLKFGT